ncbi:MAG TPA: PhaM family polyhydroxyalkanoate granule multifunctional regulatory protein, partial [Casimicrobiaceae bacterium]|nr:PhaM family polyhydroxyalkanoate granule multifunctional regulatory protein [Casimicrobiaceae bacterium]
MSDEASRESTPPFTAEDALAFMQKMWNPFGMPMPGSAAGAVEPTPDAKAPETSAPWSAPAAMFAFPNPAAMFAVLDPKELERRIGELRVIEGWLAMSLNVTQMSIRTLELQRTSLEALQAAHTPVKPK